MFSTDAGREELAASAGFNRLVIAALHPDHTYAGMEEVQAELSAKVMELAPHNIGKDKVCVSFLFIFYLKLIVIFRLCVICVREDNDCDI